MTRFLSQGRPPPPIEKNNLGSGSIHGKENHFGICFVSRRSDRLVYSLRTPAGAENRFTRKRGDRPSQTAPTASPQPAPSVQKMEKPAEPTAVKAEAKEVTVETPLYTAVFSSTGASIKGFKLKKYHLRADPESPLVELVHGQAPLVAILFDAGGKNDPNPVVYHVEENSLTLKPGASPRELTFRGTSSDGLVLQQTFRIDPDQYAIEHGFTISNPLEKPAEGLLKARISNLPPKEASSYYALIGASLLLNNKYEEFASTDLKEEKSLSGLIAWISYQEDYFMTAFVPEAESQSNFMARTLASGGPRTDLERFSPAHSFRKSVRHPVDLLHGTAGPRHYQGHRTETGPRHRISAGRILSPNLCSTFSSSSTSTRGTTASPSSFSPSSSRSCSGP